MNVPYNILYLLFFIILIFCLLVAVIVRPRFIIGGGAVKDLNKHPRTKSEAYAISILESITGEKFPTVNPEWLKYKGKNLELDGYNNKLKLALEFSGPLHTKWYPGKESYKKYFDRLCRDRAKKIICERNGVKLIVLDMSLKRHNWRNYILSRLYDFGMKDKPVMYIDEQTATPYRNPHIEKELNLNIEDKIN